ncbi:MAG: HAD-IA family hydrolase [Pseudomonadota bacterium]
MKHPGERLRAVVFDLDGTLVDTADDFVPVVQALRAEAGLDPMNEERIRATVSNGARALVQLALGLSEDDALFEDRRLRLLELYAAILGQHARPYPGMPELLGVLESRSVAWGVATNKPRELTHSLLETLKLRPGSVVCPEDVTHRKPHPESLELACRELNCRPEDSVYVGDHARDIEAGRRAGLYTVAAAYGYIEPGDSAVAWGADAIINHSTELQVHLFAQETRVDVAGSAT